MIDGIVADVRLCDGSHNSVASLVFKVLKGKYVCASSNGKLWYMFDGTLWRIDRGALQLRHEISTTVRCLFYHAIDPNGSAEIQDRMLKTALKLQENGYKTSVLAEMTEYFYNASFVHQLDSNPKLLAFTNGVWDIENKTFRKATPEDYLSLSTGFDYDPIVNEDMQQKIVKYWQSLHPDVAMRNYVSSMFAQQLHGSISHQLMHVHTVAHPDTDTMQSVDRNRFFEILSSCFGSYVKKISEDVVAGKQRHGSLGSGRTGHSEYASWKGVRIMYCTEPKYDAKLHTCTVNEMASGETIQYRAPFSHDIEKYWPQYKLHMTCTYAPRVDGCNASIRRHVRRIDYCPDSTNNVHTEIYHGILTQDDSLKMEFVRYLLDRYDKAWPQSMPESMHTSSRLYLEQNDPVYRFVRDFVVADPESFMTLHQVVDFWRECPNTRTLKSDLQRTLKTACHDQFVDGRNVRNVFAGFKIRASTSR